MPAPGTKVRVAGLRNLCIVPLSVDTSSATTFTTAIPLGAKSKLSISMQGTTSDLETSSAIENSYTVFKAGQFTIEYGEINLDAFKLMMGGGSKSDSVSGKDIWAYIQGASGGYFGIIGQPDVAEGGPADFYVAVMKAKVENFPELSLGGNAWVMQNVSGRFFPTLKDKAFFGLATLGTRGDVAITAALTDIQGAIAGA